MTPPLSKELQEQIEREAEAYADHHRYKTNSTPDFIDGAQQGHISAAAIWAAKFEQANKALEDLLSFHTNMRVIGLSSKIDAAKALLASWKEEGKEGKANE